MRTGVVGAGYVGLATAVCLAEREHETVCVDVDRDKVAQLRRGVALLDEPALPLLLDNGLRGGTLRFYADYDVLADRDVVFVCVPTPSRPDGSADLRAVEAAIDELAGVLCAASVVALKSTVPVGTARRVARRLHGTGVRVVSNPEFLREGHAIYDFRHPVGRLTVGQRESSTASLTDEKISNSSLNCSVARAAWTGPAFPATRQKARSDSPATAAAVARAWTPPASRRVIAERSTINCAGARDSSSMRACCIPAGASPIRSPTRCTTVWPAVNRCTLMAIDRPRSPMPSWLTSPPADLIGS
jgi:hypothetical protein